MRYPSVKAMTAVFGEEKAKAIRAIMEGPGVDFVEGRGKQYSRISQIDIVLGTYGVEYMP